MWGFVLLFASPSPGPPRRTLKILLSTVSIWLPDVKASAVPKWHLSRACFRLSMLVNDALGGSGSAPKHSKAEAKKDFRVSLLSILD